MRRHAGRGRMRRPRAWFRSHASGRPRVAVRSNYVGLPLMAGRGVDEGRRKPPGYGWPKRPSVRAPEARSRWTEKPQMERRWRYVPVAKARQRRKALDRWLRRTALHSLAVGEG